MSTYCLVLVAAFAIILAGVAEAADPVTPRDLSSQISDLQTSLTAVQAQLNAIQATLGKIPATRTKAFYLTQNTVQANGALTACDAGFRMASLWEIFNTSALTYDTTRGKTLADSGGGAPAGVSGWVRTGGINHNSNLLLGDGNCSTWTNGTVFGSGTTAGLNTDWLETGSPVVIPWSGGGDTCDTFNPVWCIEAD